MLALLGPVQQAHIGDQILLIRFSLDLGEVIRYVSFLALVELLLGRFIPELVIMHLLDEPVLVQVLLRSFLLLVHVSIIVVLYVLTFVQLSLLFVLILHSSVCLHLCAVLLPEPLISLLDLRDHLLVHSLVVSRSDQSLLVNHQVQLALLPLLTISLLFEPLVHRGQLHSFLPLLVLLGLFL